MTFLSSLAAAVLMLLSMFSSNQAGTAVPQSFALVDTYLASSIDTTATSFTLADGTTRDGTALSGYICFTLDVNSPDVEYVCGFASGTSVTNVSRGINPVNPNTTSSALISPHRRFASVQVTDYPWAQFVTRKLNGVDTFDAPLYYTFATTTGITDNRQIPNKAYVDSIAAAGAADATFTAKGISYISNLFSLITGSSTLEGGVYKVPHAGYFNATSTTTSTIPVTNYLEGTLYKISPTFIATTTAYSWSGVHTFTGGIVSSGSLTQTGSATFSGDTRGNFKDIATYTAGENISSTNAVYLKSSDSKIYRTSSSTDEATYGFIGFALSDITTNSSGNVQIGGVADYFSNLSKGMNYYVGGSPSGTLATSTLPTRKTRAGYAISSSSLQITNDMRSRMIYGVSAGSTTLTIGFHATKVTGWGTGGDSISQGMSMSNGVESSIVMADANNCSAEQHYKALAQNLLNLIDIGEHGSCIVDYNSAGTASISAWGSTTLTMSNSGSFSATLLIEQ